MKAVVDSIRAQRPEMRSTLEVITQDPLSVTCLRKECWTTMGRAPGKDLAASRERTVPNRGGKQLRVPALPEGSTRPLDGRRHPRLSHGPTESRWPRPGFAPLGRALERDWPSGLLVLANAIGCMMAMLSYPIFRRIHETPDTSVHY